MKSIGIKYLGSKDLHVDHLFGTTLVWQKGEVHAVPEHIAKKMLVHTGVYAEAKLPKGEDNAEIIDQEMKRQEQENRDRENRDLPPMLDFQEMDKQSMMNHAQRYFGEKLAPQMKEENMRARLTSMTISANNGVL